MGLEKTIEDLEDCADSHSESEPATRVARELANMLRDDKHS